MPHHFAFFNIPASGHLMPTLGVAEELVRRGHRVTYAITDEYADEVAGTGATVLRYQTTLNPRTIAPTGAPDWLARVLLGSVREATATAPVFEAAFADDLPDVVAYDISAQFLGRLLSRKWWRPGVQFFPVFANHQHLAEAEAGEDGGGQAAKEKFAEFGRQLAALAEEHHIEGNPFEVLVEDNSALKVVFLPRQFQFDGDSFGEDFEFVGLSLRREHLAATWPAPPGDAPLVVISLGTTYNEQPDFYRTCAKAFTETPWQVAIIVGPGVDRAEIGALPGNVELYDWLPLTGILGRATVFVCQGGPGTVMNSLFAGTPMVIVPQNGESELVATRVSQLGLGTVVRPEDATPRRILDAVLEVAGDQKVHEAVQTMREHILDSGGAARAADLLLAHATGTTPRSVRR